MIVLDQKADVRTNNVGQTSAFQLTVCAKAFKMISSDIYPNPIRAVIREISCNAHDAHIESGNDDQFEVHLPTELEPWFAVRDFGTGLSEDEMREVYTNFFKSTKSDSNDYTGAFGLGSKSPFAIDGTTNFTVVSYYHGEKTTYSCYLDENGLPVITNLHDPMPSDEQDGLYVMVDVKSSDIHDFYDEAVDVFQYFDPRPKINVPSVDKRIDDAIIESSKGAAITGENYCISKSYSGFRVVMGNVSYSYKIPYSHQLYGISGYIRVPIGSLQVDPGRENILENNDNKVFINDFLSDISDTIVGVILDDIKSQDTQWESLIRYDELSKLCNLFNVPRPDHLPPSSLVKITYYYKYKGQCKSHKTRDYHRSDLFNSEIYIDKPSFGNRIRSYVRNSDGNKKVSVIDKIDAIRLNIPPKFLKDLDTLPKVVYNRSKGSSASASRDGGGRRVKRTDMDIRKINRYNFTHVTVPIKSTEERVYVRTERNDCTSTPTCTTRGIKEFFNLENVYCINNQTFNSTAFQNEKSWIEVTEYAKREIAKYTPVPCYKITDNQVEDDFSNFKYLKDNLDKINDDEIGTLVGLYSSINGNDAYINLCEIIGVDPVKTDTEDITDRIKAICDKYPLIKYMYSYKIGYTDAAKCIADYINLIHGSDKNGGDAGEAESD